MGGSLKEEEIVSILSKHPIYGKIKTFIETGTYKGETSIIASKFFTVYTIEINEERHIEAKEKYNHSNINFYLGDSVEILKKFQENPMPTMFFLDAHQSGNDTSNNGKNVPLLDELDIILKNNYYPCIIIIDDVRLFDNYWDWKGITVENIVNIFGNRLKDYSISNDRMVIYC